MLARIAPTALLIGLSLMTATIVLANDSGKIVVMTVGSADKSLDEGVAVIEEIISDHFKDNRSVLIISSEQREALAGEDTGRRLHLVRTITGKLESNQALIFSLSRYRERVGDQYSVEDPASLAFEFKLINSEDGKVTCSGRFDETQKSLTENIFKLPQAIKRGFKWLTVKELAIEAVRDRLDTCPALANKSSQ
jgi:predicted ester cyclase